MKIRIFKRIIDGVFDVRIHTEDWSENDRLLMVKYGEPEISLGGTFTYSDPGSSSSSSESSESSPEDPTVTLDDIHARVLSESPFMHRFDSRDYGSIESAKSVSSAWSSAIECRIVSAVTELRLKDNFFTTEEITEL